MRFRFSEIVSFIIERVFGTVGVTEVSLFATIGICYDDTKEGTQMWSSDMILDELREYRQVCAHKKIIETTIQQLHEQQPDSSTPYAMAVLLRECEARAQRISGWLDLLPSEERFIVQVHLIDGLDWARTIVEHARKWGTENGRSERTLKRIQAKAIQRILNCLVRIDGMNETLYIMR